MRWWVGHCAMPTSPDVVQSSVSAGLACVYMCDHVSSSSRGPPLMPPLVLAQREAIASSGCATRQPPVEASLQGYSMSRLL